MYIILFIYNFFIKKIGFYFTNFLLFSISYVKISFNQIETTRREISRGNYKLYFIVNGTKPFFILLKNQEWVKEN